MKSEIMVAAHRGAAGGNIPCNTLEAFKAAVSQGADIVELDVTKSSDGQIFVFHGGFEFAHLGIKEPLGTLTSSKIKKLRYLNSDLVKTDYCVLSLDEALDYLKGKAMVNIDRSWTVLKDVANIVKAHKMVNDVIIKTRANTEHLDEVEAFAPNLKYMPIINTAEFLDLVETKKINYYGVEVLFKEDSSPLADTQFIEKLKRQGKKVWVNSIVYDVLDQISGGHNDDISITGNPDNGWGWLINRGFDIIQTDFPLALNLYIKTV